MAMLGPQSVSLHHPGTKAFEQSIGLLDQLQDDLDPLGTLDVHANTASPPRQRICADSRFGHPVGPINAKDFRSHVIVRLSPLTQGAVNFGIRRLGGKVEAE